MDTYTFNCGHWTYTVTAPDKLAAMSAASHNLHADGLADRFYAWQGYKNNYYAIFGCWD